MPENTDHNYQSIPTTPDGITKDLLSRFSSLGKVFRSVVIVSGMLFVLGIIGFFLRLINGHLTLNLMLFCNKLEKQ